MTSGGDSIHGIISPFQDRYTQKKTHIHTHTNTPTEVRESLAVLLVELQELEDVFEHLFWGVEAPDEVQMFPVLNLLMVDQVGDLGEQDGYVLGVRQRIVSPGKQSCRNLHVLHVVQWWGRLVVVGHVALEAIVVGH